MEGGKQGEYAAVIDPKQSKGMRVYALMEIVASILACFATLLICKNPKSVIDPRWRHLTLNPCIHRNPAEGTNKRVFFLRLTGWYIDEFTGARVEVDDFFAVSIPKLTRVEQGREKLNHSTTMSWLYELAWWSMPRNHCDGRVVEIGGRTALVQPAGISLRDWLLDRNLEGLDHSLHYSQVANNPQLRFIFIAEILACLLRSAISERSHADIKPDNMVMIPEKHGFKLQYIDFATASFRNNPRKTYGTAAYRVPTATENCSRPDDPATFFVDDIYSTMLILLMLWGGGGTLSAKTRIWNRFREILKIVWNEDRRYYSRDFKDSATPAEFRRMLTEIQQVLRDQCCLTKEEYNLFCYLADLVGDPVKSFSANSTDLKQMCLSKMETYRSTLRNFLRSFCTETEPSIDIGPVRTLQQLIHKLERHVSSAETELKRLGSIKDALELSHAEKDGTIVQLQREIAAKNGTIGQLQATIDKQKKTIADLDGRVTTGNKTVEDLQASVTLGNKTIEDLQARVTTGNKTIEDLLKKMQHLQDTCEIQRKVNVDCTSFIDTLMAQLTKLWGP